MFYAAAEIIFWILLAAVIGGGIGYGLSQARALRLNQRLAQSRADAPMERELAIAWDTIEDLNRRLQVAHETIRESNGDTALATDEADEETEQAPEDDELDAIVAEKLAKAAEAKSGDGNGTVGTRLSERVASASRAKNLEFTDGLDG